VEVTEVEQQRIESQGWSARPGWAGKALFVSTGPPWRRRTWLAQGPDGACVFLAPDGLCRIHSEFGPEAKPLPCRAYPIAFLPDGSGLRVFARFSCPSAAEAKGHPIKQLPELSGLAGQVLPPTPLKPPRLRREVRGSWEDLRRVNAGFEATVCQPMDPLWRRLLRGLALATLLEPVRFDRLNHQALDELLSILVHSLDEQVPATREAVPVPSSLGRLLLRQLVGNYLFQGPATGLSRGLGARWRWLMESIRFVRGVGAVPNVMPGFPRATFAEVESAPPVLDADAMDVLDRFYRVRIAGMAYFGYAHHTWPLIDGFRALALVYPVVSWLVRWQMAGPAPPPSRAAVVRALGWVERAHDHSPYLGFGRERFRVRVLARTGDLERLVAHGG
jgi:lysine-N-methylase